MNEVFSLLNNLSGKRGAQDILVKDFGYSEKAIFECLERIYLNYKDMPIDDYSTIKYGKLITPDSEKVLADKTIIKQIQSYIEQYEKLLTESSIFKISFNHNNAEEALKMLGKNGFFKAKHQVLLSDTKEAIGENDFKRAINEEKARILDQQLAEEFYIIDQLLSAKAGTKSLRDFIFDNKNILPELLDINEFKKKIWVSYLFDQGTIFEEAILNYQNNRIKLERIVEEAREQTSKWHNVVMQFNERFSNMPFKIEIVNKEDVVLKSQLPSICFKYESRGEETSVEEKELLLHLSNGEKKALYLLNIIFEVQARKELGKTTLLIMDDIADSFDYRNKYAIIEYIKDIVDSNLFMPIILTHNFDFYRTVAGRVGIKPTSNFVKKNMQEIKLVHGQYFENVFDSWRNQVYKNNTIFISSISFIRNLVEYTRGKKDDCYLNLTSLMHYKKNRIDNVEATEQITIGKLIDYYVTEWGRDKSRFVQDRSMPMIKLIMDTANEIASGSDDSVDIENKIVLSIASRLKAEKYMITRIGNDSITDRIQGNQTRKLRENISFDRSIGREIIVEDIIERVLIITSENIHINSFMYEPIVDMSLQELIKLYNEVDANLN